MKKNVFSTLVMIVMIAALLVSFTGCSKADEESAARIAELEAENADLRAEVEALTSELSNMKQKAALQDWTLDAAAWNDGNGATVTFAATPVKYVEGQKAALSVRVGDLEAESTNCVWDGTSFTGSVELSAVDGYSYYCVLTNLDGSQAEVELNSPENTTDEMLVYLGSSLSTYANLVVEDWTADTAALNLHSGYVQVQMPRMTSGNTAASISSADLVLHLNSEEVSRQAVALEAG